MGRDRRDGHLTGSVARRGHKNDTITVHLTQPRPRTVEDRAPARFDGWIHRVHIGAAMAHIAVGAPREPGQRVADRAGAAT
jgi:hypothetical protein